MEWKPCPHYSLYEVSDTGLVRSWRYGGSRGANRGKPLLLRPWLWTPKGRPQYRYRRVGLRRDGKTKFLMVHRLVCEAFHGPPPEDKPTVEHHDGDGENNNASNLSWASYSDQREGERRRGTLPMAEKHYKAKMTTEEVEYVRSVYEVRHHEFGATPLGLKYGVTRQCISRIVKGLNRKSG